MSQKIEKLRTLINENLRVQRYSEAVNYIDTDNLIHDLKSRQNHAVFARRGCGKTLLLLKSAERIDPEIRTIYLNCEDFKRHSFPDVLLEILESVFIELQKNTSGWFGRKKKLKEIIAEVISSVESIRSEPDEVKYDVKETEGSENGKQVSSDAGYKRAGFSLGLRGEKSLSSSSRVERAFIRHEKKLSKLDKGLPGYKRKIKEFFDLSKNVKFVYIQLDDLYHLDRVHQAFVVDYVHRLCKDLPLFFKIATLRHSSTLFIDRAGQPFGAQERHDFQPVDIDYDFSDFEKTRRRNFAILAGFAQESGFKESELKELFKGDGFNRLVMAGGGVPRDVMSLFLEMLQSVQAGDGRIGKDDVRIKSKAIFERRIEELKQDSREAEQEGLLKGIYLIRRFCLDRQTNIFNVSEEDLKRNEQMRALFYRLLDYRIIHNCASALTHKSKDGTFQAFAVDIGCYGHMRKLVGRFNEIDVSLADAKERMRSAPILTEDWLGSSLESVPEDNIEASLLSEE